MRVGIDLSKASLTATLLIALLIFIAAQTQAEIAQQQTDELSATAGASTGATIMVDKIVTGEKPVFGTDVTLEWDPSSSENVTGYYLYYGNASGKYLPPVDVGNQTSYTLEALSTKKTWYFSVKAYDADGNQSDYSNEVIKVKNDDFNESTTTVSTAMSFTHDPLTLGEAFGKESESAGIGEDLPGGRIVAGTGAWPAEGGWIKTLTEDYFHSNWSRVDWALYNENRGEARLARGDIDGDGRDEIVIGMGPIKGEETAPAGHFEVLDDNFQHLYWGQVNWGAYNEGNGETWPACGDIDGDGRDEILIGMGRGGMGIIEVFKVSDGKLGHHSWMASTWTEYNYANGEVRPAAGDLDNDGRDEIVIGLASVDDNPDLPAGNYEILTGQGKHLGWGETTWNDYNLLNGETRPAIGDFNGDGVNEIVIGLGKGANGALEIQSYDDNGKLTNRAWLETPWWQAYNDVSGETRPAVGNLDDDASDELVVALGEGGGGWLHLFDDEESGFNQYLSLQLWPEEYNLGNGSSWVTIQRDAK